MRRLLISGLFAATVSSGLLVSDAGATRSCGNNVTVTGSVPCYKARSIVREFKKTRRRQIQGFTCRGAIYGGQVRAVYCRAMEKRIRWKA
jgi:hypothetical protein